MTSSKRLLSLTLAALLAFGSTAQAQSAAPPTPSSAKSRRSIVVWTIAGAGAGFGIGLSAGLNKYDDAINSDRKVWTSAVVGAAIGAAGGYLISRLRNRRSRPATTEDRTRPATTPRKSVIKVDRQWAG
jgi:hypothetical protein